MIKDRSAQKGKANVPSKKTFDKPAAAAGIYPMLPPSLLVLVILLSAKNENPHTLRLYMLSHKKRCRRNPPKKEKKGPPTLKLEKSP